MDDYLLNEFRKDPAVNSEPNKRISILNGIETDSQALSSNSFFTANELCFDRSLNQCIIRSQDIQERYSYIYIKLDETARLRFRSRMQEFLSIVQVHKEICVKDIVLDTYSESSMLVSFEDHSDIKLAINLNEPDCFYSENSSPIENVEVAYLTYKYNGQRHTVNNTLKNIIKQLLEMYA